MEYQGVDVSSSTSQPSPSAIPEQAYYPTRASLDAAATKAFQRGNTPRVLLLSHPQNPLGICYPPHVMKECIEWCRDRKIHLISDEIYAGSVYRGSSGNFKSAMELGATITTPTQNDANATTTDTIGLGLGPYIHLVYALSKDFALSGLRVGVSYSENPAIRVPLQKLNDLCCISSHTQLLVEKMITAHDKSDNNNNKVLWTKQFLTQNHERLTHRCNILQDCLDELEIPHLKAQAGLFVWMDLREFLPAPSSSSSLLLSSETDAEADARERVLYLELVREFGLLFTPGRSMKNELPGFFRCVFSAANDKEFALGLERLRKYVHTKRQAV
jgi:1-aminocyclopropane-1-carboxylate synthase